MQKIYRDIQKINIYRFATPGGLFRSRDRCPRQKRFMHESFYLVSRPSQGLLEVSVPWLRRRFWVVCRRLCWRQSVKHRSEINPKSMRSCRKPVQNQSRTPSGQEAAWDDVGSILAPFWEPKCVPRGGGVPGFSACGNIHIFNENDVFASTGSEFAKSAI